MDSCPLGGPGISVHEAAPVLKLWLEYPSGLRSALANCHHQFTLAQLWAWYISHVRDVEGRRVVEVLHG